MTYYRTVDGDVLDAICWRRYGEDGARQVPAVLAANPGLAERGPILPAGVTIALPDRPVSTEVTVVRLWT